MTKDKLLLLESEGNFRNFFEAMSDIIIVGSQNGKIIYTNPAVSLKLGYSPAELKKMHVLDIHPADKRREAEEIFAAMFRGEREVCPLPLQHKDGALVPVETRAWIGKWRGADCIFGFSRDIRAEQEALQKFSRLFDSNPAPMATNILSERKFTDVNDAWLNTFGYAREEVIGKTSEELGLFVQPEKQQEVAEQLIARGQIADIELKVKCKDGTILDGLFSGDIIESQGKKYLITVMVDQTKRKQMEDALKQESDRLLLAVRAGGVGIWDLDTVKNVLVWDDEMLRLYGITADTFGGAYDAWKKGLHPDDLQRGDAEIQMALRGEKEFDTEFRVIWPDGTIHNIRALALVQRDASGRPMHMIGTNWDITEYKRLEESLRNISAYNRNLLEVSVDPLVTVDHTGMITDVNEATEKITGFSRQYLIGTAFSSYFSDPEKAQKGYEEVFREGIAHDIPLKIQHRDGHITEVLYNASVYRDKDGQVDGILAVAHDITERKRLEEVQRESLALKEKEDTLQQGLKSLKKTIGDMISTLSTIVAVKDPFTASHQLRVAQLAIALAKKMNLPDEQVELIQIAATLHDIGKIYVPSDILNRPGKLLPIEYQMIQMHAEKGYEILRGINFDGPVAQIVFQHQERIDGSGYPRGIKESEILPEARILAVADVVEAMSSHRPYRPALGVDKALEEISKNRGELYSSDIVDACLELFTRDKFEFTTV